MSRRIVAAARRRAPVSASCAHRIARYRKRFPRRDASYRVTAFEALETRRVLTAALTPLFELTSQEGAAPLASAAPVGYTPAQIRHAYGFDQILFSGGVVGDGTGQTIAIVDAYHSPTIQSDLHAFSLAFGLPDPPSFIQVAQDGTTNFPTVDPLGAGASQGNWELETALDVEWAHALAPKANILLVEASSPFFSDLVQGAVDYARHQPGVVAVSMSFGSDEFPNETSFDQYFTTPTGHSNITFLAATGDHGRPGGYPAFSSSVIGVGGTTLTVDSAGNYVSESGWSGSGGSVSTFLPQPAYQQGVVTQSTTHRANPDVAFDADPATGVVVYDSYNWGTATPWIQVGGTSLSSPAWASIIAVADQGRAIGGLGALDGASQSLPLLYQLPAGDFHDSTTGSNGFSAGPGYDLVTGRGSPRVDLVVGGLSNNGVILAHTDVSLDATKNLVITDLANVADNLTIQSDTAHNRFIIHDPGKILDDSTGVGTALDLQTLAIPFSAVTGSIISVSTAGGTDSLTVDFSLGAFNKQVDYDAGDPATSPGDSLILTGGTAFSTATFTATSAAGGSVDLAGNSTILYHHLERVVSQLTVADDSFRLPIGPNSITLGDDGTSSNSLSRVSGTTVTTVDFANPTGSLTINRGSATDTLTVAGLPDFTAGLILGAAGKEFGSVTFTGAVALAANKNLSVLASGAISLTNNSSNLATSGGGAITLSTFRNISLAAGSSLTTATGDITLAANQETSPTSGDFVGIELNNAAIISTSGKIILIGRGGDGAGGLQAGVFVHGGGTIGGGTTASVTVAGTGGPSSGNENDGVLVADANSMITSGGGAVNITARGGGTTGSGSNYGVYVRAGGQIKAGNNGTLSVQGFGGATTGDSNLGVFVNGTGSAITSIGGAVSVTGQGGGSGASANNYGVDIQSGGQIAASGSGTVAVQGTGGATAGGVDIGVFISDANSQITSGGGAVTVTGQGGGSGTSTNNHGVSLQIAGQILAGGDGAVSVQGTAAGLGVGVLIAQAGAQITSSGGTVAVTGQGTSGNSGIQIGTIARITTVNNAALTLTSDRIDVDTTSGVVSAGSGTVNIMPQTPSLAINLGGANSATQLGLTSAELGRISAGTINFGDTQSYAAPISVSNPVTVTPNLNFQWFAPATSTLIVNAAITTSGTFTALNLDNATLNADISAASIAGDAKFVTVDNNPSGKIQDGIDLASPIGTVQVLSGTYSENIDASSKSITLTPGIGPAQVTINGNVKFGAGDTLAFKIAGANATSQFDNFIVNGTVTLGGATLGASLVSFNPAATDSFTIVDNDASDAVSGTFNGLAENQVFLVGTAPFRITYQGGSGGNNVVLTPVNLVQVAVSPNNVPEDGNSNLVYTFTRLGPTTADVTVNFTVGGTADFSTDYTQTGATAFTGSNGSVKIPAGSATATLTVKPTADATVERDETVLLSLSTGAGYVVATQSTATGTIANDDTAVFTINDVTVDEGAGTMQFTVSLSNPIDTVVKVNVNFTDVTTSAADFDHTIKQVTFAANSTAPQTVTVPVTNDTLQEGTETFTAALQLDASTPLSGYATDLTDTGTGTITDNDAPGNFTFNAPASGSYRIVRNGANDDIFQGTSHLTSVALSSVSITFNGTSGDDQLTVDYSGGDPVPSGGLIFNGGAQATLGDSLRISGSSLTAVYTPDAASAGRGAIAIGGHTVSFTGLEPIDFDVAAGAITVSLPNANSNIDIANSTLTDGTTPALKISGTSGGTAFENVRVRNSAVTIDTTAAAGNDTINIASADNAHGNTSLQIKAGTQSGDVVNVNGTTKFSGTVTLDAATINLNADVVGAVTGTTATTVNVAAPGQIADGINLAATGATVNIAAGNYSEDVDASAKTLALSPAPGTAQIHLTGNLVLGSHNTVLLNVNGTNPATQYDNFVVSGAATLGNSTLNVALGSAYTPASGDLIKIIDAGTLSGTFGNFTEGAVVAGGLLLDYHVATGDVNLLKNSPPSAVNDTASATEAGGTANATPGVDPSGNVLTNDTDADHDLLTVTAIRAGAVAGSGTVGTLGAALVGQHGSLTLGSNGAFSYVVNNADPAVDALNTSGTLTDSFNYTVTDGISSSTAVLTITIHGANDAPVAVADAIAVAGQGGTATQLAGGANSVLSNDTDVDTGDTKTISQVNGAAGNVGVVVATSHGTIKLNADGTFTYVHDGSANLSDSFTYEVSDSLGLKSTTTVTVTISNSTNPDTTPNSIPDLAAASDSGASNTDNITNVKTPTLTGTTAPGLQVELIMDGSTVLGSTTSANPSGNWSITASSIPDGAHLIIARVHETNGNISNSTPLAIVVDTVAPAKPIIASIANDTGISATDGITSDTTLTLNGTAEADAVVAISEGATQLGTATADSSGTWSFVDIRTLADGPHPYTATATDVAGDTGAASTVFNAVVDTTPPTISAPTLSPSSDSGGSSSDNITNVILPTITGAMESGATVTLFEGATPIGSAVAVNGSYSITLTTPLAPDGPHSITAKASDVAGNTSGLSAPLVVTIDTLAPTIGPLALSAASDSGASDQDRITNVTQPVFTGTAETGATVLLLEGSTLVGSGLATAGTWSIKTDVLADGVHSLTAKAVDAAGNSTTSAAISMTIDTIPPTVSVPDLDPASDTGSSNTDNVTDITTPKFNGTSEPGATVTLLDGAAVLGTAVADGTGNWSITSTVLSGGAHTISADAVDLAGNVGHSAGSLVVSIGGTLQVTSLVPTASGFDVTFNRTPVLADLNLYDGFGAAGGVLNSPDVVLHGAAVGDVAGSLIWHADTSTLSFIKTGGVLANDTYTVTVVSGANAVHDSAGHNLDGNSDLNDQQANDNYTKNFTVNLAAGTRILSTPDFARGPSQIVNEDPTRPGSSLAVNISDASAVVSISFDFHFDPLVLSVSGASLAPGLPEDWSMSFGKSADGDLTVLVTGTTPLSGLNIPIAHIDATILKTAAYGSAEALSIDNLAVMVKGVAGVAPANAIGDSAIHAVAYLGDADGNAVYTGVDAAEIARVAGHADTGFHAYPNIDPAIIGNVTATGSISATDAAYVAQKSVGLPRPEIPDLPQAPVNIFTAVGAGAATAQPQVTSVDVQANPIAAVPISVAADGTLETSAPSAPPSPRRHTEITAHESALATTWHDETNLAIDGGANAFSQIVQQSIPPRNASADNINRQLRDDYFEMLQTAGAAQQSLEQLENGHGDLPGESAADADELFVDMCFESELE